MKKGMIAIVCAGFGVFNVSAALITANLGVSGEAEQLSITKEAGLGRAVYTDIALGAGVRKAYDMPGVSTPFESIYTEADVVGSRGYRHWQLPENNLASAISTDHYLQFALTLSSNEVVSLDGIIINGVASTASVDSFALFVSTDGFSTTPESGNQIANGFLPMATAGSATDAADPYKGYGNVHFTPASPLFLDAEEVTFTFRLYIRKDAQGNARTIGLNSIKFVVSTVPEPLILLGSMDHPFSRDSGDLQVPSGTLKASSAGLSFIVAKR
jgi:hypothetical protein